MTTLHIDFETRSTLELPEVGLYNYVRHPTTDVWCMAWAFDDGEVGLITPDQFPYVMRAGRGKTFLEGRVVAHNAAFELAVWNNICVPRYGWPVLRPEQTYCTMAQAYSMGLPGALEDAALALGLKFLKDTEGRALMLRMARPRRIDPDGTIIWWNEPEKLARLYDYCKQDVRVERTLEERLMPLSDYERKVWLMDYAINNRGVMVDLPTAKAAIELSDKVKDAGDKEIAAITNGAVQTNGALIPLKAWIADHGVPAESMAKQDVVELLNEPGIPKNVRRVLQIRQEIGKASVAKLKRMEGVVGADGRVHNAFQYHGAATGRWAGRGVQLHNLTRDLPDAEEVEATLVLVRAGDPQAVALMYGPPLTAISRCLRSFFLAPPGKKLIAGDFSAIEGRGTAWISGEEWKLKAFRAADAGTGPGIYELAYAKSFGVPVESVKNPSVERQIGKVQELLLGYGGGIGALRRGGGALVKGRSDPELDAWKMNWRDVHPMVVYGWKAIETAAIAAVRSPGTAVKADVAQPVVFKTSGSFLWCLLPSGRCLCYPYSKLLAGRYGDQLTYMTVPGQGKKGVIDDPANSPKWARCATYGGSLMENVVQALCRDLLVDCMLRLHDQGAGIVLHVHDEVVIEVDEAKAEKARDAMEEIMCSPPAWAAGFPLVAAPAVMRRYGK